MITEMTFNGSFLGDRDVEYGEWDNDELFYLTPDYYTVLILM